MKCLSLICLITMTGSAGWAQHSKLIIGKWIIDSVETEYLVEGVNYSEMNAALKNEVVQFDATGRYMTMVDTTLIARYDVSVADLPILIIYSVGSDAHRLYTEAEIIRLDESKMVLGIFMPEFNMFIHYRRLR